jgi:poly-gamma-glutamate synthesis protein (capsule biosynthesis protein)
MDAITISHRLLPQRNTAKVLPHSMPAKKILALCAGLLMALAACSPAALVPTVPPTASALPTATVPPTPTIVPSPTPLPTKTIWIDPLLPANVHEALMTEATQFAESAGESPVRIVLTTTAQADVKIAAGTEGAPLITRTFAVAAPFPTVADEISFENFKKFWAGDAAALANVSADGQTPPTLFMDADTRAALVLLLGEPADNAKIQLSLTENVLAEAWAAQGASLAVVPFDQLEARWKLLRVDGINLFEREADMAQYPLTLQVRAAGDADLLNQIESAITPSNNRDLSKMTIVAMTGVTAMVRGTAVKMEQNGVTYPAEKIRDWLTTADITHISNEVSFWDQCPPPSYNDGVTMCSNVKYMDLLRYVGTDVIELTGNHLWDYGFQKLGPTIDLYEQEGWRYFGGGRNIADALKPLTMTVNGNKIAFVGCNYFGVDWATTEMAGSAPCSPDDPKDLTYQINLIRQLRAEGYQVISTLQYEEYYFYQSTPQQRRDFAALRDAGAAVVNGSQGHHAQGFDVSNAGFIHWGTGNLFFGDQDAKGARQTFVDRHVFYDGRYLGVDLRTAFIVDDSQPVPMTPEERRELLNDLFAVSVFQ